MDIDIMPIFFGNIVYFLKATVVTIYLSLICLAISIIIGVFLGVLSVIGGKPSRAFVEIYVYILRGIPLLVMLFYFYYALPAAGLNVPSIFAAICAISLWTGAYMTEIFRGAILSISKTQVDAGYALGMQKASLMKLVILPQAFRYAIPPCMNMTVRVIKGTSMVSIINIWELTYAGREIVERTMAPFQVFGGIAIIYFLFCYCLSILGSKLERKYAYVS